MFGLTFWLEDYNDNLYCQNHKDYTQMWRETAQAFGATHVFVINCCSNVRNELITQRTGMEGPEIEVFNSLTDLTQKYPDEKYVYLETSGTKDLFDYTHPESAIYVTGPDSGNVDILTQWDSGVIAPEIVRIECTESLWSIVAMGIVAAHRYDQRG